MKILALDAATEACSVALTNNGETLAKFEVAPQQHAKKLLPMAESLLVEAGIGLKQLDAIAFGQGPGSFTGVRIGVSVAQGLAYGADLPLVGVSSLATMAQQVFNETEFEQALVAIDARMSEVYWAQYQRDNGLAKLIGNEHVNAPADVPKVSVANLAGAGTGWQTYLEQLISNNPVTITEVMLPKAEFMLPIACELFGQGNIVTPDAALPNYVRDEVSWKKLPGR